MSYGKILQKEREAADLSIRGVADKAGISEGFLRFLEKGDRETSPEILRRLAAAIGMSALPLLEAWLAAQLAHLTEKECAVLLPRLVQKNGPRT